MMNSWNSWLRENIAEQSGMDGRENKTPSNVIKNIV